MLGFEARWGRGGGLRAARRWGRLGGFAWAGLLLAGAACGDEAGPRDVEDVAEVGDFVDDGVDDIAGDAADGFGDTGGDVADVDATPGASWRAVSLGDVGQIGGMTLVAPDQGYAVSGPRVLRWDGRSWSAWGQPGEARLRGVWAGDGVVVAVGDDGTVARRATDALGWTLEASGTPVDLHAVWGQGPETLWAVGDQMTVLARGEDGWSVEKTGGSGALLALWGDPQVAGAGSLLAVGTGGRLVRYEGGEWVTQQIAANAVTLHGVWGAGALRVAVGSDATVTVKASAGSPWQGQSSNDTSARDLFAVTGAAADDVAAFGASGAIVRFDGAKWSVVAAAGPNSAGAELVAGGFARQGLGSPTWMALGRAGGGVRWSGSAWVDVATRPTAAITGLAAAPDGTLWASGGGGLAFARVGGDWTSVELGTSADLHDVAVAGDGSVWWVGDGGTVLRREADGAVTQVATPVPAQLLAVAADAQQVVVAGKGGTLLTGALDATALTPRASGTVADLRDAAFDAAGTLWLSGAFGTLLRAPGEGLPQAVPSGVGGGLNGLAAFGDGVLAVGDGGVVLRATGDGATVLHEQPGLFLYGVGAAGDAALAVGWNGAILRWDGQAFVAEAAPTQAVLEAVWLGADETIAVGRGGALIERVEAGR